MSKLFIEENGAYSIDCEDAVWATDKMHEDYHNAGIHKHFAHWKIRRYQS